MNDEIQFLFSITCSMIHGLLKLNRYYTDFFTVFCDAQVHALYSLLNFGC
jgi:hypothetical protein